MKSSGDLLEDDFDSRFVNFKRFLWFAGLYLGSLISIGGLANGINWVLHWLV